MNEELTHILAKVRSLYMKYGVKSITMDDVARELGISKKTLYQFVSDKDELVGKVIDLEIQQREFDFSTITQSNLNAIDELFEISGFLNKLIRDQNPSTEYDLRKYYPQHYHRLLTIRRERLYNYLIINLKKGKEQGFYRECLKEEIIAKLHLYRLENIFTSEIFTAEELASQKLFNELIIYHLRGIANKKGIDYLENKLNELNPGTSL